MYMSRIALPFDDLINPNCPYGPLLDDDDHICYDINTDGRYQVYDERSPDIANVMADIRGLSFDNVHAKPLQIKHAAPNFVPLLTPGKKLTEHFDLPYAAVQIGDVISPTLKVNVGIRKSLNIPDSTKLVMLGYGKDDRIEKVWPKHPELYRQLAEAGIDLFVPPNYSMWHSQPHLERLINPKRSLIVYETIQSLGLEAIPHVYWSGSKDIERWAHWINTNSEVKAIAIDLQTIGSNERLLWRQTMTELAYLSSLLNRPIHYLISGPQVEHRIRDVIHAVGVDVTFTGGNAAIKAWNNRMLLRTHAGVQQELVLDTHKSVLFAANTTMYMRLIGDLRKQHMHQMLGNKFAGSKPIDARLLQWYKDRQANKPVSTDIPILTF
jgi:hypothetical protein